MNFNLHKYEEEALKREEDRKLRVKEAWNNLGHFEKPEDVPVIPVVNREEYERFYLPRLWKAGAIPKKDLIDGQVYIGKHRRCTVAKWNAEDNEFKYWRYKFGGTFLDTCNHFEDDDEMALFVPIKLGTEDDFKKPEK